MDIKNVIKKHGFKQVDIANALGVTKGALNQAVHNENVSINMLRKIASVIGCSVAEFFEDEVVQKAPPVPANTITCPHCNKEIKLNINASL